MATEYNVYSAKGYYDDDLPNTIIRVARYERTEGQGMDYYNPETFAAAFIDTGIPSAEWPEDMFYYDTDPDLPWFVPLLDFETEKETTR